MVPRYAGASLGLLAFAIVTTAGLLNQNPLTVTLSRAILAMFVFFFMGMALGYAAQLVVREHERKRESQIRARFSAADPSKEGSV